MSAWTWLTVRRPVFDPSGNVVEWGNTVKTSPGTPGMVSVTSWSPPTTCEPAVLRGGR